MQSDPYLKRIMRCQIGLPGLRLLLFILLSSVCLGTSNPDLKRSLCRADHLQHCPSRHCCQQSSHYRKEDLYHCNDFAVRIQAQALGQFLPTDGHDYWQQLQKQSRSTLSSYPRPVFSSSISLPPEPHSGELGTPIFTPTMAFPSPSHHAGVKGLVGSPGIASFVGPFPSATNFPLESPSVASRTVFAPSMIFPSHSNYPGRKGHASPPSIASAEPPWNRPITHVATPVGKRSWRHVPVVTARQNQGPVSSIFAPPSEVHEGSTGSPLSATSMIFPSPPYHAGHTAFTRSINMSEPPQKRLGMPMAVPPQRITWRHTPVIVPHMIQGPGSSPPATLPPAPLIGNSRSSVFSPSVVLLTPSHGRGMKGPAASHPSVNVPEPPNKRLELPVAAPPQRRLQRHMPIAVPPMSQGPVSSILTPPPDQYQGSSKSPVAAPSMIFPSPPYHAGHVASTPSINVSEPPQKRLEIPMAVPPHRRSWRHTSAAIPPISQGPVASPSSINVPEPPQKRPEMPVAVPPQRSWRHLPVASPPTSQGPVSSNFIPPSEPYRGGSRSPVLAPSMIFPSPPHHAGHVASTPSNNVSEPPQKRSETPTAVPPHRRSQTHTRVAIPPMSQGSVSSSPVNLLPAPPQGISRNPVFSPPVVLPTPPHFGGVKGAIASHPSINPSEPPQNRLEIPVAVPPQRRSQRHMPVASTPARSISSPSATHPPLLAIGNSKGPVFAPSNILSTPAHHGGPVTSSPSISASEPPQKRSEMPVAVPTHGRSHRHMPAAIPPMGLGSISSPITFPPAPSIGNSKSPLFAPSIVLLTPPHRGGVKGPVASPESITPSQSPLKDPRVPVAAPPKRRSRKRSPIAIPPISQGSVSSPYVALSPDSPPRNSKMPAFAPSIIFPSPLNHQGPVASPNIAPFEPPQRQSRAPVAAPPMQFPPPPPAQDCSAESCADPLTYSPPGSPCGCVSPMQVELELGVALYAFFPLVPELALEIAAGTYLKPSQVRIMGANSDSQDQDKTLVIIDLVPLGQTFDNTTAFLIYNKFWQKKVMINETLFGDYRVIYVHYPGLPLSPPSAFSNPTGNGNPFGRSNGPGRVEPLGANIRKRNAKMGSGTIAVVALSSAIAAVICLGAVWIVLLKCSNQSRLPSIVEPTFVSSVTKRSGGGSILSGSLASSTSMSIVSSMATYTGSAKTFTLSELEKATDRFSPQNILGEGGFGRVYRGVLEDGMKVAVKVLTRDDQHGGREFIAEVEMLSRLHHRNLVKLIGTCTEGHNRCLVYELIPNGSVESHLHGVDIETAPLDWDARMKIALGAARGLAYLHEDSSPRVIHRDFKASNILLEDDFTPKVSDFGLAKAASEGSGHISTRVMGTFGYVAPEYAMTGHLLVKSDVYSYGVVLLELLSGRKPVDMSQPPGQENLVTWARSLLTSKEGLEILKDPALGSNVPFDNMARVAAIASMCVQPEVSHRPFMGEVVQALKLVYNDSDTSNAGGSGSCSQLGGSSAHDNEVKDVSGQMWCSSTQYVPDSTSFVTIDYDSGPLQTRGLEAERPLSASALLPTSGRLVRQLSGSFRRHNSSGPLRTHRSKGLWYGEGSISEHHMSRHLGTGLDGDIHELWP